ncbi:MAG: hypothetical protein CVV02_13850 [Firmicutes bacterium HGW-Firmicutes-7]|nr:MAG: hypothetical protein CVV02_13850 [Firmicutes bacterium HGW-Firmicutes-7]
MSRNKEQFHNHEFVGSTRLAALEVNPHNHRFAGVSSQAICVKGGHVHEVIATTDFYEGHLHEFKELSSLQISVGDGRHVHFVEARTTVDADHKHKLIFATLIEDPIGDEC